MERVTDAERLAALLDGRLSERDRAEMLARLASPGEELDVLADAAAVTRELEEEDRAAGVVSITAPRRRAARPPGLWRWVAAAAAAAVLLALAPQAWRALRGGTHRGPEAMVAMLADTAFTAPEGWQEQPWGGSRGGGGGELGRRAASVQFGARAAALTLAVHAGDLDRARAAAGDMATVLRSQRNMVDAQRYQAVAEGRRADPGELERLSRGATEALDKPAVDLGAWAEAARVAARRHDAGFFETSTSRAYLEGRAPELWAEAVTALLSVRDAAPHEGGAVDWTRLEDALSTLLANLG